jgi:hypothetical protein
MAAVLRKNRYQNYSRRNFIPSKSAMMRKWKGWSEAYQSTVSLPHASPGPAPKAVMNWLPGIVANALVS